MSFNELIVNGSFETGTFAPWTPSNATITSLFSHSGFFAAQLAGGATNAFIFQFDPILLTKCPGLVLTVSKRTPGPAFITFFFSPMGFNRIWLFATLNRMNQKYVWFKQCCNKNTFLPICLVMMFQSDMKFVFSKMLNNHIHPFQTWIWDCSIWPSYFYWVQYLQIQHMVNLI